jgi:predicted Zn-dependent peptidase
MIDRSVAPVHKEIKSVNLDDYELKYLSKGIPVYVFNTGAQNVVSIEIIFEAGSFNQSKPLVASCTNALLMEGTTKYSSQQINEAVDFYGSFLQTDITKDVA